MDEARLLRRVDSDHLIRVYDIGELPDGRPYFVMTHADAGNLADRLAAAPAPWDPGSVLAMVDAVVSGLTVLHRHGVVHRDVKPSNILLRRGSDGIERVLIGDLGIAKDLCWASGITVPSGSTEYVPPEQRTYSDQVGPASDVHALAVTAARLLGLSAPWPNSPLGQVLARATWPDPARRTESAEAFATQLRAVLAPPTGSNPSAAAGVRVTGRAIPGGRRRALVLAGAVAVVLVLGVTAWWAYRRDRMITPRDGGVSIRVSRSWTHASGVTFPGGTDADAGVRAGAGPRSVAVAFSDSFEDPSAVLDRVRPRGCTSSGPRTLRVGPWDGMVVRYAGCPDGTAVDEVALGVEGDGWTVWVEVRSTGGDPDLSAVLSTLDVTP